VKEERGVVPSNVTRKDLTPEADDREKKWPRNRGPLDSFGGENKYVYGPVGGGERASFQEEDVKKEQLQGKERFVGKVTGA